MKLARLLPATIVYAHCDIPCGVYSAEPSKIAALAVLKIAEKINAVPDRTTDINAHNNFVRLVLVKEREAQHCKEQLLILWTDFFKPEHLEKYPDLHEVFWLAAKQCSLAKRSALVDPAKALVEMVDKVAKIFDEANASMHKA